MKRHPALEPFSRDHNYGLILARRLSEGVDSLPAFREAWEVELRDHFEEEERLLLPICSEEEAERMRREHQEIATLGANASTDHEARRLGELLHDHIRWEERELFVALESRANEASLRSLSLATRNLERRRGKANPLRAELVARRPSVPTEPPMADLAYLATVSATAGPQWGLETEDLNATLLTWSRGEGIAAHVNHEVDVLIVVLAGEVTVTIDDVAYPLREGQSVAIPKGTNRSLATTSDRAAHLNVHRRRRRLMPV